MDLGLEGKAAAVAAASSGLGLATARALADEGVRVALCGRDRGRIEAAAARVGGGAVPLVADVSDPGGAEDFVARATSALGAVDILVTNAGGPPPGTFESTPVEAYPDALALNLLSVVAMCRAGVPAMRARGWGRVVAITSISVRQPISSLILSNTARAGATAFLKTLATEVAGDGVTVNSVQPGSHATQRLIDLHGGGVGDLAAGVPTGVVGDPADFGAVVTFLCSRQARFLTGAAVPVDGGVAGGLQ
ncbi:MAG TPA: SDR family oxidoreductase [Acidimicrobiales bacterium]|nr:SDR family oxidoreductase [Acidimicrobiales bacterium]